MKFILSNVPMPPSHNQSYWARAFMMGGKPMAKLAPSRELDAYVKAFGNWALVNNVAVAKAKKFIRDDILMKGKMIGVDAFCCFPGTSLWTQKGLPKRMDASNRIKALHDCLAETLTVDDSSFWDVRAVKMETSRPEPWVFVELYPVSTISVRDWQAQRNGESHGKTQREGDGDLG